MLKSFVPFFTNVAPWRSGIFRALIYVGSEVFLFYNVLFNFFFFFTPDKYIFYKVCWKMKSPFWKMLCPAKAVNIGWSLTFNLCRFWGFPLYNFFFVPYRAHLQSLLKIVEPFLKNVGPWKNRYNVYSAMKIGPNIFPRRTNS